MKKINSKTRVESPVGQVGIISSLSGLMVEIQIVGEKPEIKELLTVEDHPEVFLEVGFFRSGTAVCLNLSNKQVLRCGQKVFRSGSKVTIPVGPKTIGRVFNALGEPLDDGPQIKENRRSISEATGTKSYRKNPEKRIARNRHQGYRFLDSFRERSQDRHRRRCRRR
jgi:F0F1-type ATP synthase beta subunit